MTFTRRPRAFISYRHSEHTSGPGAEELNRKHVEWVAKFAEDLRRWNVDVVDDFRVRRLVNPLFGGKAETSPFMADIMVASLYVCQSFIPIITPGYLERLGYGNYQSQTQCEDGYVLEEFQCACALAHANQQEFVPVFRAGDLQAIEQLPLGFNRNTMHDLRFAETYEDQVELLAERLHLGFQVENPPINKELRDWLSEFIQDRIA